MHNVEERVIYFGSRSLTDVERQYSLTEREALGIVWACELLHMFLYGRYFKILIDHKLLEFSYSKLASILRFFVAFLLHRHGANNGHFLPPSFSTDLHCL